jgi:hypothetical protein
MENTTTTITPKLLQEIYLCGRDLAVSKVNAVFDAQISELCIRTRYPKEVQAFIAACLSKRGELEAGAGQRCLFIRNHETWEKTCNTSQGNVLIAHPELDFEGSRNELLQLARKGAHSVIYALANPRADISEIIDLVEPSRYNLLEVLKNNDYPPADAESLANRSNGNVYLFTQLLTGTTERRAWATGKEGYDLRLLALVGGWNDASDLDKEALNDLLDLPYKDWVKALYPLTREKEPPILLEGKVFRPISRYEVWQQLGHYLTDTDIERFADVAVKVLSSTEDVLDLPENERSTAFMHREGPAYSKVLRKSIAETLTLLGGQGAALEYSPPGPAYTAERVVHSLLNQADWKIWASLSDVMPLLAEAAPSAFLDALELALKDLSATPLKEVFVEQSDLLFSKSYHVGLLWALEILAWNADYLNRVCVCLTRLATFPLSARMGNNPAATLRSIFLSWMPQTLATVEQRRVAVEKVIEESSEVGWNLLLAILPESHQSGSYHQRPVWRDWIGSNWREGVTYAERFEQDRNYAELALQCALGDDEKLTALIKRWIYLPRDVFKEILGFIKSDNVKKRAEKDRFTLWQGLVGEAQRHRHYSDAKWAMPESSLKELDEAADAIRPTSPAVLHRWLFNRYDPTYYETKDYEVERRKIEHKREEAVSELILDDGISSIIEMAKAVERSDELGQATGRIGTPEIDAFLLPEYLENEDQSVRELMRGYIWARYFKTSIEWVKSLDAANWTSQQQSWFFSKLPFHASVWRYAAEIMGGDVSEYWIQIWPNVYQAEDDLLEAVTCALDNKSPAVAISALHALVFKKKPFPVELAVRALRSFVENGDQDTNYDRHDLRELIKFLQESDEVDAEDVEWVEVQFLQLLDGFSGGTPVFLERKLATDPKSFHELVSVCFRSESEIDKSKDPDPEKEKRAGHFFSLLDNWKTPPGTTETGDIDPVALTAWMEEAECLCVESGHWAIAQQMIGHTFAFPEGGIDGLLKNPAVCKVLDAAEYDDIRIGFRMALFNARGVCTFTYGVAERKLSEEYRDYAKRYDLAKFHRIAAELRKLADSYERDAERNANRNPFRGD